MLAKLNTDFSLADFEYMGTSGMNEFNAGVLHEGKFTLIGKTSGSMLGIGSGGNGK